MKAANQGLMKENQNIGSKNQSLNAYSNLNTIIIEDDGESNLRSEGPGGFKNSRNIDNEIRFGEKETTYNFIKPPRFKLELPKHIVSFENFKSLIDPLLQNIDNFIKNDAKMATIQSDNVFEADKAVHLVGAILQNMITFTQTDRVIEFSFNESRIKKTEAPLSQQATKKILTLPKSKNDATQSLSTLHQEFILTTQESFNPFLTYDEKYVLNGIEELINRYESVSGNPKSESRLKSQTARSTGVNDTHKTPNKISKERCQRILDKVKNEVKDTLEQYYEIPKNIEAMSIGGEIKFSFSKKLEPDKKCLSDEINLRDKLISEYNIPTENGLQDILRSFLIVRSRRLRISLHTAILLSIVYYLFAKRLGKIFLDDLTNYITISSIIPFSTTSTLIILNYRYFLVKALDIIISGETENCAPKSAYLPTRQEFCKKTHKKNEKALQRCGMYIKLYDSDNLRTLSEISEKLSLYQEQLVVLNNIFKLLVQNSDDKDASQLSKKQKDASRQLVSLISEAKKVSGLSSFFEYELLTVTQFMMLTGSTINQKDFGSEKILTQRTKCEQTMSRSAGATLTEEATSLKQFQKKKEKYLPSNCVNFDSLKKSYLTDGQRNSTQEIFELNKSAKCDFQQSQSIRQQDSKSVTQMQIELIGSPRGGNSSREREEKIKVESPVLLEKGSSNSAQDQQGSQNIEACNNFYNQILSNDLDSFFLEKLNLQDPLMKSDMNASIQLKLKSLLEGTNLAFEKYPELAEKSTTNENFLSWVKWLLEVEELSENLQLKVKIQFNKLDKLYKQASELNIPNNWPVFTQIKDLWTLAEKALGDYHSKFQARFISPQTNERNTSFTATKHELSLKIKSVPLASEAKDMIESLTQALYFMDCEEYINELNAKLRNYSICKAKINSYIRNQGQRVSQAVMNPESVLKDFSEIELRLSQLRSEYLNLDLREEQDERSLKRFECQLRAYSLMRNLGQTNQTTEEWKKILEFMEGSPDVDKKIVTQLKAEISHADKQAQIMKKLKNPSQKQPTDCVTVEELRSTVDSLQNGLVKNSKDAKAASKIVEKADELINQAIEMNAQKNKVSAQECQKIVDHFKKLPLSMPNEIKSLEEAINLSTKIAVYIRKYLVMDIKATQNILKQYEKCPILILEAEQLQNKFNTSKTLYGKLKRDLSEIFNKQKTLNYQQLEELSDQIDDIIYNFEDDLNIMKAQALTFRIEFLQKLSEPSELSNGEDLNNRSSNINVVRISPQALKILVAEGHSILTSLQNEGKQSLVLNNAVRWLEDRLLKTENQIKEINLITSLEDLNKIHSAAGFVDLSENISDRKLRIISETVIIKASTAFSASNKEKIGQSEDSISILQDKSNISYQTLGRFSNGSNSLMNNKYFEKNEKPSINSKENYSYHQNLTSLSLPSQTRDAEKLISHSTIIKRKEGRYTECPDSIQKLRNILKDNLMLSLDDFESLQAAQRIVRAFPVLQKSKDKFQKFIAHLKRALKYPNVTYFLSQNSLDPRELSNVLSKSQLELSQFEEALKTSFIAKTKKAQRRKAFSDPLYIGDQPIKKKVKNEDNSKPLNLINSKYLSISQSNGSSSKLEKKISHQRNQSKDLEPRGHFNRLAELI